MRITLLQSPRPYERVRPSCPLTPVDTVELSTSDPMHTDWGYGARENRYNRLIERAVSDRWGSHQPPLPPLLMKSLVAQESAFDPRAVSPSGYVGLTQLGRAEALAEGLKLHPRDERYDPYKNLRAGVGTLAGKKEAMLHPERLTDRPFALKVAEYYEKHGRPEGNAAWHLILAAYNGGQGTMLRAMARAIDMNVDPRVFNNLIEPTDRPTESPLYHATLEVFGPDRALSKYREIARYPVQILARAPQP